MGEVIKFPIKNKIEEKPKERNTAKAKLFENSAEKIEFVKKYVWIVEVVYNLRKAGLRISLEDIELRRRLTNTYSDDEIIDLTMKVTDAEIKKHPSFYEALTDEIIERKLNK